MPCISIFDWLSHDPRAILPCLTTVLLKPAISTQYSYVVLPKSTFDNEGDGTISMSTELRNFLALSYDELEDLNLKAKEERKNRTAPHKVQEERLKYLTDEKR